MKGATARFVSADGRIANFGDLDADAVPDAVVRPAVRRSPGEKQVRLESTSTFGGHNTNIASQNFSASAHTEEAANLFDRSTREAFTRSAASGQTLQNVSGSSEVETTPGVWPSSSGSRNRSEGEKSFRAAPNGSTTMHSENVSARDLDGQFPSGILTRPRQHRDSETPTSWRTVFSFLRASSATAIFMSGVISCMRWHASFSTAGDAAISTGVLLAGVGSFNFAVAIPDAYALSAAIGGTRAYSRQMVGAYMLSNVLGAALVWLIGRVCPEPLLWRGRFRSVWFVALGLNAIGAALYAWVAVLAYAAPSAEHGLESILFCGRLVAGIGNGMSAQAAKTMIPHVSTSEERPAWCLAYALSSVVGLALGPVAAISVRELDKMCQGVEHLGAVGAVQAVVCFGAMFVVSSNWRPLVYEVDQLSRWTTVKSLDVPKAGSITCRQILLLGVLLMSASSSFVLAGQEAALALAFATLPSSSPPPWSWTSASSIAILLLLSILIKLVHEWAEDMIPIERWIQVLSSLALKGAFLLQFPSNVYLLAHVMLFAGTSLADAVGMGIAQQHLLPGYFLLDADTLALMTSLAGATLGHLFGAWAGFASSGSEDNCYAWVQITAIIVFMLAFRGLVQPNMIVGGGAAEVAKAGLDGHAG